MTTYSPDEMARALQYASPATQNEIRALMAELRLQDLEDQKMAPQQETDDE